MKKIDIKTNKRNEMIDITDKVAKLIEQYNVDDGVAYIYVPHTTAAVTINEGADPDVQSDIIKKLENLIPKSEDYEHMEGNSDAHIKASLLGPSVNVIFENKKLVLGTWQHIFFYEGDGPRTRRAYVKILSK